LYNFSGITIPAGLQDIFQIESTGAGMNWGMVLAADWQGNYVKVLTNGVIIPIPEEYTFKAFPNPSDGNFTVTYELPETAKVNICIYSVFGEKIGQINDAVREPGKYEIHWPALNENKLSGGLYICAMQATNMKDKRKSFTKQVKLIIVK
jgi:hypothetical protein